MEDFILRGDLPNIPIYTTIDVKFEIANVIMENIRKFSVCEYDIDVNNGRVYNMLQLDGNDDYVQLQCESTQMIIEYHTKFIFFRLINSNNDGCTKITQTKKSLFNFEGNYNNFVLKHEIFQCSFSKHIMGIMSTNGYSANYIVVRISGGKSRFLFTYAHEFTAKMQWLLTVFLHEQIQNDYTHTIQEQVFANDYLVKMILRY